MDLVSIDSTPSLVLVTIIASVWAIKSTGVNDRSITIVVAPIISVCGSQTINPLLEKSSLEFVVSTTLEEFSTSVAWPLVSVVGLR